MDGVFRVVLALLLAVLVGCATERARTGSDPRPSASSYPETEPPPADPPADRELNPQSQVWPLDLWLVEFAKRNGVELKFRDRDTIGRSVVRPGPGPYDTDDEALDVLRRVCRRNNLSVLEERAHVFAIRRLAAPNPIHGYQAR